MHIRRNIAVAKKKKKLFNLSTKKIECEKYSLFKRTTFFLDGLAVEINFGSATFNLLLPISGKIFILKRIGQFQSF